MDERVTCSETSRLFPPIHVPAFNSPTFFLFVPPPLPHSPRRNGGFFRRDGGRKNESRVCANFPTPFPSASLSPLFFSAFFHPVVAWKTGTNNSEKGFKVQQISRSVGKLNYVFTRVSFFPPPSPVSDLVKPLHRRFICPGG